MPEPIDLLDPEVRANPFPSYARMRLGGPVQQILPGGFWAVHRAKDVEFVLKNPQIFPSGFETIFKPDWLPHNPLGDSMITKDGPGHTKLRALVSRAFTPRALARIEPQIRAICVEAAERLAVIQEGDFVEQLCGPVPGLVIADLLGLDRKLHGKFKQWIDHLTIAASPIYPGDETANAVRANIRELEEYFKEVITDRRIRPRDDTVNDLLTAEIDGQVLTNEEIVSFLFLLLAAGYETTTHLFSHALLDFDQRPEAFTRLREDPKQIPAYVEELLRKEPPVHAIFRTTAVDTELGGVPLPRGSMVVVLLAAANRDAARFAEPDRFDTTRASLSGFAFGHGTHYCLGAVLARLEARCMLEELATRFLRFEKLPGEIPWKLAVHLCGPEALPFRAIPAPR
jgi:cytochrome P450